nr:hypothetical protein BaRGS_019624 [Batillaria attramentaria]
MFVRRVACRGNVLADDKEKRLKSADEVIQSYIEGVLRVLDNLGYTQEEILKMAGVYGKVEERNVLRFLAEIEEYINKLWMLQNYDAYQIDQEKRKTSMLGAARITTPLPNRIEVEFRAVVLPPAHTHEMDDFMDDRQGTSVRPITLREVGVATDMVLKEAKQIVKNELELRSDSATMVLDRPTMSDAATESMAFRRRTMLLMMGQRAERLRAERVREEESQKMRTEVRSTRRQRGSLRHKYEPILNRQQRWRSESLEFGEQRSIKTMH